MNIKCLRSTAVALQEGFLTVQISQDSGFKIPLIKSNNSSIKHHATRDCTEMIL